MEAGKRNIADIFNRARALEIPFFQRTYVWEEEDWSRFLDDMVEIERGQKDYFLGSIILKQRPTGTNKRVGDIRTIVDGQQRLTTLLLLFKVLCEVRDCPDRFRDTFYNYSGDLILRHNHNDKEIFEAIVNEDVTTELRSKYEGSNVLGAFSYFRENMELIAGIDPISLLTQVYFVGIDLSPDEDEQQIFDTINSLGVALTTAELLKNELFQREDLGLYERTWKIVFEDNEPCRQYWGTEITAGRTYRVNIDLFLQSFLLIQPGIPDDVRVEGLSKSFKSYLGENVENRQAFVEELSHCAKLYRAGIDPSWLDQEIDKQDALQRLNVVLLGLNTTTVIPYVLFVLRRVDSQRDQMRIFRLIESYLMRRLICRETTKYYNKLFASFIRAGLDSYEALSRRLTESEDVSTRFPTDEMVLEGFQESNLTNQQARVVLYIIERSIRNDTKQSTALSGFTFYTLEHLLPKKWRNHWGSLESEAALERDQALRKLGNLSLLSSSLNTSIRDSDWTTKKTGKGKSHGLDQYARGLETLADDLAHDEWNESHISSRGQRLAEQAIEVWPWPKLG